MSLGNVSPTRMELARLKKQLQLSIRGHKLLKDKQDELMRQFVTLIKETHALRASVEGKLTQITQSVLLAKAAYPDEAIRANSLFDQDTVHMEFDTVNIMGLHIPQMRFEIKALQPAGFRDMTPDLLQARLDMYALLPDLLQLAKIEKTAVVLAGEIEKIRRRVNALEHMTIPQLSKSIRFIKMRLEDNERDRITRLIKMEDMESQI